MSNEPNRLKSGSSKPFGVGAWRVEPALNRISLGQQSVALEPKVMALLIYLAEHAGETLSKDQLLDELWAGQVVVDQALTRCVSELRRVLEDDRSDPRYIQTIPKRGYRLIAAVQAVPDPDPASGRAQPRLETGRRRPLLWGGFAALAALLAILFWRQQQPTTVPIETEPAAIEDNTLAVLPFVNMGEDEHEYFSDGLTEALINQLAQHPSLKVVARTSAFAFKGLNLDVREIGQELGVALILEGSVRRDAGHVRVTAQLLDARTGLHLWSEEYDTVKGAIFTSQDLIAGEVAQRLGLEPVKSKSPAGLEATDLAYLAQQAARDGSVENLRRAILLYEQATALAPDFAEAWAGLAIAATELHSREPGSSDLAENAIRRAKSLRPDLPVVRQAEARRLISSRQFDEAERALTEALDQAPNHWGLLMEMGHFLRLTGRASEALPFQQRLLARDPYSSRANYRVGMSLAKLRRFDEAHERLSLAIQIDPESANAHWALALLYRDFGLLDQAVHQYNRAISLESTRVLISQRFQLYLQLGMFEEAESDGRQFFSSGMEDLGRIQIALARQSMTEVNEILERLEESAWDHSYIGTNAAIAAYALGDVDRALRLIDRNILMVEDVDRWQFNHWDAERGLLSATLRVALLKAAGREQVAGTLLKRTVEYLEGMPGLMDSSPGGAYTWAQVAALQGNYALALERLVTAVDMGWRDLPWSRIDPSFSGLQDAPGWITLLARIEDDNTHMALEIRNAHAESGP